MLVKKILSVIFCLSFFYSTSAVSNDNDVAAIAAESKVVNHESVAMGSNDPVIMDSSGSDLTQHQVNPASVNVTAPPTNANFLSPKVGSGIVSADPFTLVFGLLFIVLLIFLVAFLLRKMGAGALMGGQSMKVVAALSVGTREKVILVDVAGKQILLGVAPGRISHLKDFEEPVVISGDRTDDFSSKLKKLLHQQKSDSAEEAK